MKKKLESELISIAHRILKLKNKSDLVQLHSETRILYEKLSVLKFVEENFETLKPTIGKQEVEDKLDAAFAEEPVVITEEQVAPVAVQPEPIQPEEVKPEVIKPEPDADPVPEKQEEPAEVPTPEIEPEKKQIAEESSAPEVANEEPHAVKVSDSAFTPAFEWAFDKSQDKPEETDKPDVAPVDAKSSSGQIAFDDLLGSSYVDPVFVKPEELENERRNLAVKFDLAQAKSPERLHPNEEIAHKTISLNDRLSKGITVGLNDRVAFVKHLFNNSSEDYNRVLSQLITFDTFAEAQEFIDQMVKPDYNNWIGKDEYAVRFMEVVEKKFS
jgi:hypothetical protein